MAWFDSSKLQVPFELRVQACVASWTYSVLHRLILGHNGREFGWSSILYSTADSGDQILVPSSWGLSFRLGLESSSHVEEPSEL